MKLFSKMFKTRRLPDDWDETKISKDTLVTHIPQKQKDTWKEERRKKDKANRLCKTDGFHDKQHGRTGTIYYVETGKVCELYYEISGVKEFDILIWFDQLNEWFYPTIEPINIEDKKVIKEKLTYWLNKKKIKAEV